MSFPEVGGGLPDEVGADEQRAHGWRGAADLGIVTRVARVDVRILRRSVDAEAAGADAAHEAVRCRVAEREVADAPVRSVREQQRVLVLPRVARVRRLWRR